MTPAPDPAENGALAILSELATECECNLVFANPGTTEMQLVAALDILHPDAVAARGGGGPSIRPVLCLHETVATGAADGYARMARRPALALLHLGPGLSNGMANAHNARRARVPLLMLVGGMATWHEGADAPLQSDAAAMARTVSRAVVQLQLLPSAAAVAGDGATAAADAAVAAGAGAPAAHDFAVAVQPGSATDGRVVTLLMPHDAAWAPADRVPAAHTARAVADALGVPKPAPLKEQALGAFVADCAKAVRVELDAKRSVALYLGGGALACGDALAAAGRISAKTGCTLLAECMFSRVERGRGTPANLTRLPYFPQEAQAELRRHSLIVFVDTPPPVAMFGYQDGPSKLCAHLDDDHMWQIDSPHGAPDSWHASCLTVLADALGATPDAVVPGVSCRGVFEPLPPLPRLPKGRLTPEALCTTTAALQPPNVIIVDESLTSGGAYWRASRGCDRFSHLSITGGAIGCGPPMAVGAAFACPGRLVINLQADGSAMYSPQALWTQAREGLPVITLICDNAAYSILRVECARQRLPAAGPATRALTNLGSPRIDWVAIANGMGVPAVRVDTCEALVDELRGAIERCTAMIASSRGPYAPAPAAAANGSGGAPTEPLSHTGGPFLIQAVFAAGPAAGGGAGF
ncbi:hypothetical protein FOA52_005534 [Chlamydomonas sp. UWO 241]|nr:hypothetical protein FOA52_005534 [Chlamydomonas sp. UWO 241]